jgi:inosine-uridine nucleoside N-ribohydrolase
MNKRLLAICSLTVTLFISGCRPEEPLVPKLAIPPTSLPAQSPSSTNTHPPPQRLAVIFDDDGSRDGTVALLYLLSLPQVDVKAINTSYGEAHPEIYSQHLGRVLDDFGIKDIPLGAGQDAPLEGRAAFPDWLRQLSDNFWEYPLPNTGKTYPVQEAPELMVAMINQAPEPITIFLSGTFTNLAQALRLDPGIKDNIAAVYFMGGAVYAPGNITGLMPDSGNAVAEWNIYTDPNAAKEVFESGLDMYMVPLDATGKVLLSQEDILPWRSGDEKADLAADLYEIMFNNYGFKTVEIFDLTAAVVMVEPDSCEFTPLHLQVNTDRGDTSGQTLVVPDKEPNVNACLAPDAALVEQALIEAFSR